MARYRQDRGRRIKSLREWLRDKEIAKQRSTSNKSNVQIPDYQIATLQHQQLQAQRGTKPLVTSKDHFQTLPAEVVDLICNEMMLPSEFGEWARSSYEILGPWRSSCRRYHHLLSPRIWERVKLLGCGQKGEVHARFGMTYPGYISINRLLFLLQTQARTQLKQIEFYACHHLHCPWDDWQGLGDSLHLATNLQDLRSVIILFPPTLLSVSCRSFDMFPWPDARLTTAHPSLRYIRNQLLTFLFKGDFCDIGYPDFMTGLQYLDWEIVEGGNKEKLLFMPELTGLQIRFPTRAWEHKSELLDFRFQPRLNSLRLTGPVMRRFADMVTIYGLLFTHKSDSIRHLYISDLAFGYGIDETITRDMEGLQTIYIGSCYHSGYYPPLAELSTLEYLGVLVQDEIEFREFKVPSSTRVKRVSEAKVIRRGNNVAEAEFLAKFPWPLASKGENPQPPRDRCRSCQGYRCYCNMSDDDR